MNITYTLCVFIFVCKKYFFKFNQKVFIWGEKCFPRFKKTAFTLAEVMIVLGIIGIVAEFTIPSVMQKVHRQAWIAQLKKFYSTQNEGWLRILASYEADELSETDLFHTIPNTCTMDKADTDCKNFFDGLKKYFKFNIVNIKDDYEFHYLSGGIWPNYKNTNVMVFQDGSIVIPSFSANAWRGNAEKINEGGGQMYTQLFVEIIDVNGLKGPNKWGRDIFEFEGSDEGKMFPTGGKDVSLMRHGDLSDTWQKGGDAMYYGWGAAGRIMDEGWQMNY